MMYNRCIILAFTLTSTAEAGMCCYWSGSGDSCGDCGAQAQEGSFCAASEGNCVDGCSATWCGAAGSCVGDYSRCQGCGGEQCTYCRAEEDVNCCIKEGGDLFECCNASAPYSWRYANSCDAVQLTTTTTTTTIERCDVSACNEGTLGKGQPPSACQAEEQLKCCVRDGASKEQCCNAVSPYGGIPETCQAICGSGGGYWRCKGCGGEQCTYCRAEEDVSCCIKEGGDLFKCCHASAPYSWRYSDVCDAVQPTPEPTAPTCSDLWGQCGGRSWAGATCCNKESVCQESGPWYSQCLREARPKASVPTVAVTASLDLNVAESSAFAQDLGATRAVKATMKAHWPVWRPDLNLSVSLRSTQRRLKGVSHRRQAGNVIADITTMVFEPDEAAALVMTITNLDSSLMTASLAKTLTVEGLSQWANVTVLAVAAAYTPAAEETSDTRHCSMWWLAFIVVIAAAL